MVASTPATVPTTPVLGNNHHPHHSNAAETPEFVSYEEYSKMKDRVVHLESEVEVLKKQVKLLLDKDFGKGHIV
jgi:hypothetical protein